MNWLYYIEQQGTTIRSQSGAIFETPIFAKLGVSDNPKARLAQLQTANPLPLKLASVRPVPSEVNREQYEKEVHSKFKEIRQQGEWFLITEGLKEWIKYNMLNVPVDKQLAMSVVDYFTFLGEQRQVWRDCPRCAVFDEFGPSKSRICCEHALLTADITAEVPHVDCHACKFSWLSGDTDEYINRRGIKIPNWSQRGFGSMVNATAALLEAEISAEAAKSEAV